MKHKIRLGILGGGGDSLIGIVHRIAANMYDRYELVGGCFNPDPEQNRSFADKLELDPTRVYDTIDALVEGENKRPKEDRIQVVS
ncbi:MAG: gfo/Idh/MocA family oxidoreductase, partial [Flavobacteriaceae bacterium]